MVNEQVFDNIIEMKEKLVDYLNIVSKNDNDPDADEIFERLCLFMAKEFIAASFGYGKNDFNFFDSELQEKMQIVFNLFQYQSSQAEE